MMKKQDQGDKKAALAQTTMLLIQAAFSGSGTSGRADEDKDEHDKAVKHAFHDDGSQAGADGDVRGVENARMHNSSPMRNG